jgi:methylated-DNA-[protein]-cysteine S-methyltransferase
MTEGVYVRSLGSYINVEWSGPKVKRVYFSQVAPEVRSDLAEEIAAFLESSAPRPQVQMDLSQCSEFKRRIYEVVQAIPRGETMTYGEIADAAGRPGAARAVGQAMACNPFAILVPCHRVIAKNGLGGFAWGLELKEKLQMLERSSF